MATLLKRWKKALLGMLVLAGALAVGYPLIDRVSLSYFSQGDFEQDTVHRVEVEIEKPQVVYGMTVNHLQVIEDVVRRNQRFVDLINGYRISSDAIRQLLEVPRDIFDFRKIAANQKYVLIADRDSVKSLHALVYVVSPLDYYVFHFGDTLRVEAGHHPVEIKQREVAGVIGSTLAETIEVLGISNELTNRFVDIFAWTIDFQRLQKGDRFKLVYEEQWVEGRATGIGKIHGIFFEHFNEPLYAIPFDQGNGVEYFDYEGNSLRKVLLKYPIEFTRISSRYNPRRFHPVDRVFRAHRGTDFAAARGTPIRSVGDGLVQEAQYNGKNGNYVKIRHNSVYTTQYLHMSKIAAGLRPGDRVTQGETIGYVGSTGLSTGPHLCYRFWKNGVQVDALRIKLPPSQPVKEEFMGAFEAARLGVMRKLDQIVLPEPPIVAARN